MPGPKHAAGTSRPGDRTHKIDPVAGDGLSIVTAVEVIDDSTLELPSVEGYRSERKRKVRTADGPEFEIEYYWTKKNLSRWLSLCPKVAVHLPPDRDYGETNAKNARKHPVYIDGIRIDVDKGKTVMVALPVALILQQMQEEYRTAGIQGIDLYLIDTNDAEYGGYETTAPAAG